MKPKKPRLSIPLFTADLNQCLNPNHPLVQLSGDIDWSVFEAAFGPTYDAYDGRPGKPIRLLVGLHYLKAAYNESDESVVERWLDSPYWQYFCGFDRFQHACPIDPSNLGRWRKRVGPEKMEALLKETIETAKRKKLVTPAELSRVNVDTTVQEKNIAYRGHGHKGPTEIHLAGQHVPRTMRAERRWMKRRAAIEPIIGHAKSDHRMDRNYLKGTLGDKLNALLAAAGFNFRKLIREYARIFLRPILEWLLALLVTGKRCDSTLTAA